MESNGFRRLSVPAARLPRWLDGFVARHGPAAVEASPRLIELSAVDGSLARVSVPFPPLAADPDDEHGGLLAHVAAERAVGVLLVRRGGYAAGVFACSGAEARLVASKVGARHVQGTTKAGGWSQQRFARRRANQAQQAFAAAADAAVRVLASPSQRGGGLDALVCGGDRAAVRSVLADHRLASLGSIVVDEPFLAVPDPRLRVLAATPEQFLAVRIDIRP